MALHAVFVESIDLNLKVYESKDEAQKAFDELQNAGKPVRMEVFEDYHAVLVEKANGAQHDDPEFWEGIVYDNGKCRLLQKFSWHKPPAEEGYYPDYVIKF